MLGFETTARLWRSIVQRRRRGPAPAPTTEALARQRCPAGLVCDIAQPRHSTTFERRRRKVVQEQRDE